MRVQHELTGQHIAKHLWHARACSKTFEKGHELNDHIQKNHERNDLSEGLPIDQSMDQNEMMMVISSSHSLSENHAISDQCEMNTESQGYRCELCPDMRFEKMEDLNVHLSEYHIETEMDDEDMLEIYNEDIEQDI